MSNPSAICLLRAATSIQSALLKGAVLEEVWKAARAVMEDWSELGMEDEVGSGEGACRSQLESRGCAVELNTSDCLPSRADSLSIVNLKASGRRESDSSSYWRRLSSNTACSLTGFEECYG